MAFAYLLWLCIVDDIKADTKDGTGIAGQAGYDEQGPRWKTAVGFAFIVLLDACIKLSSIANGISIDRDWLPMLAPTSAVATSEPVLYDLTHLNAVMRRINLICKVLAPVVVDLFVSSLKSYRIGIALLLTGNICFGIAEMWLAREIFVANLSLHEPKLSDKHIASSDSASYVVDEGNSAKTSLACLTSAVTKCRLLCLDQTRAFKEYFSTVVWIPSMARALVHLTVLAFTASLITYLLDVGFPLDTITVARVTGAMVEVASTVAAPWAIHHFSRKRRPEESKTPPGSFVSDAVGQEDNAQPLDSAVLEYVGLTGITWQWVNLVCVEPLQLCEIVLIVFNVRRLPLSLPCSRFPHDSPTPRPIRMLGN